MDKKFLKAKNMGLKFKNLRIGLKLIIKNC